ncbi:hyalin-like [Amphiura filiformis]|uniref:hyalin-like n=1 Tax=Amphiura filiformis TaxID=82378 RepID=UPI003B212119
MWVSHVVNQYNIVLMLQILCILPESMIHVRAEYICEVGRESEGNILRWFLLNSDPCRCTKVRLGGSNAYTPKRMFDPVYVKYPLIGDDVEKIREHYALDCIAPEIASCPGDQDMVTDPGRATAMVVYQTPNATDNFGDVSVLCYPESGSYFPIGNTTVDCVAKDKSENSARCNFEVNNKDKESPEFDFCPSNSVERDTDLGQPTAMIEWLKPMARDNSGDVPAITCTYPSGSDFAIGETTVECLAVDSSGNEKDCQFDINVLDNESPEFDFCPNSTVRNTDSEQPTAMIEWLNPIARDNSGEVPTITCNYASGTDFAIGETTVECVAVDNSGNEKDCQFDINVLDNESPEFDFCPSNPKVQNTDLGQPTAMVEWLNPMARDNSGEVPTSTCNYPSGSDFAIGETTVDCLAVDSSGNEKECQFDIHVLDNESPKFIFCPSNTTLRSTDPGQNTSMIEWLNPMARDNSGEVPTSTCNYPSGSDFVIGETTVDCLAVDSSGNEMECQFNITILVG